jgi:hypothetical protein
VAIFAVERAHKGRVVIECTGRARIVHGRRASQCCDRASFACTCRIRPTDAVPRCGRGQIIFV